MPSLLWLEWERDADGYHIESRVPEEGDPDKEIEYFVPIGDETIRYRPLEKYPALFMEFADVGLSFERVKAFVEKYGLLELEKSARPGDWMFQSMIMKSAISVWQKSVRSEDMAELIEAFNQNVGLVPIQVMMIGKPSDSIHPTLYIVPKNLLSGLWLQFAQAVSANAKLRSCGWCSTWFRYGAGTGRRKSANYCSDRCRKAAHKRKKETGS